MPREAWLAGTTSAQSLFPPGPTPPAASQAHPRSPWASRRLSAGGTSAVGSEPLALPGPASLPSCVRETPAKPSVPARQAVGLPWSAPSFLTRRRLVLGLAWALSLRRSVLPQETTRLVSGRRRRRQVQGGLGGQGQSRPGLASPAFACLGLRPVTLWPPKPSRRPCGEAWGRGPWPQLPGLGSAGCRGHWSSDPRRRQGGPAGGACRSHSPPALDPGPWPQGPPEARSFSAGVGCCSPCVLSSVAPHGSEDPRGRRLPGPGRPGGGGGSRPLPASAPSLRLPLGLRAQPSPGTSSKALGGLAPRSPCQQPRERREPGPPWPQPAPGSLILLGAPRLPPGRSFSRAWGAPRRGAAVMAWPARGTVLGVQRRTEQRPAGFGPGLTLPLDPGWAAGDRVHWAGGAAPCCARGPGSPAPDSHRARPPPPMP